MKLWHLTTVVALFGALAPAVAAETYTAALPDLRVARGTRDVAAAWLADATPRYAHFVLGARYEAASLRVRTKAGSELALTLPEHQVFEDREPRLADLDGDGTDEIVIVRSSRDKGAALVVIGIRNGQLSIVAETQPTGRPNTWLNPAGIADFDGDGRLDIAYVQMPHVLGKLRVVTLRGGKLVEIATIDDVSNHAIGARHIRLSVVTDLNGDGVMDLAIPSLDRRSLRFLTFKGGAREIGRKALPEPAMSDFELDRGPQGLAILVGLASNRRVRIPLR